MRKTHVGTVLFGALLLLGFAAVYSLELRNRDLRDFGTFWASGDAALHQLPPYGVYPLTWHVHVKATQQVLLDPNLSPPALLPIFEELARWNPKRAVVLWTYASLCAFAISALLVALFAGFPVPRWHLLWMLLAPSVLHTLWLGQDYGFLVLVSAVAWLCFRYDRRVMGGVLLGVLCAAKPNLLLWPFLLLLAGYRRSSAVSLLTFATLSLLPAAIYGPRIYSQWFHAAMLTNHSIYPTDVSLIGYAARLGLRPAGFVLAILLAIAACVWAYQRRPAIEPLSGAAICASLLCSPLAWFHYTVLLMPWMAARRWNRALTLSALLLMFPLDATLTTLGRNGWAAVYGGLPYFLAVVVAMASFVRFHYCVEISIMGRPVEPEFPETASSPSNVSRIMW